MTDITAEDAALPRETGQEKSTVKCPICKSELPVVTTEYGSTAPGACPTCWPKAEEAHDTQLEAQQAAASEEQPKAATE